ncbi:EexN family lipoprotein [Bartonella sp. CB169]|uniref:EexN family lipoprotein n=1 Tax=Bartonella sp. CB169 TaxID=3112257 RepID=UPI00300E108D
MNKTTIITLLLCTGIIAAGCEKTYSVANFKKDEQLREEWLIRCGWTGDSKNCENVRVAQHQIDVERRKQAQEKRRKEEEEWRRTAGERRKKAEEERVRRAAEQKAKEEKWKREAEIQAQEADKRWKEIAQEMIEKTEKIQAETFGRKYNPKNVTQ